MKVASYCENNGFCYFYSKMNTQDKKIYEKLLKGIKTFSNRICVKSTTSEKIKHIYQQVLIDNPEIYYMDSISYEYSPSFNYGIVFPKYRCGKSDYTNSLCKINSFLKPLIENCFNKTDYEKELLVHDYICKNIIYENNPTEYSYESVGPLLYGKGVCEGISKAAKFIFDLVGLKSLIVHGIIKNEHGFENHAWNIVQINDTFYHLDITFDITINDFKTIRYDYFNLSTEKISIDHYKFGNNIPYCYIYRDYYLENNLTMFTPNDLYNLLLNAITRKTTDVVFKVDTPKNVSEIIPQIVLVLKKVSEDFPNKMIKYKLQFNEKTKIFHLHLL